MKKVVVDARGEHCPIPVVKTRQALQNLTEAGELEIHISDENAYQNVSRMLRSRQLQPQGEQIDDAHYVIIVRAESCVSEAEIVPEQSLAPQDLCGCTNVAKTVVVIASNVMGQGDDVLGRLLLKGFIFALTQQECLPDTVLFYNGGAQLTCEGSEMLEDIRELSERGVEILTCGTCLQHYGLKEKLAVGEITNMYAIVEKMMGAGRVIRP